MDSLERVIYCSRATVPTGSLTLLTDILAVSQRNNERDQLTGALAVSDGWFLHVVEGPPHNLDRLLGRLEADTRHTEIAVLQRRRVKARMFEGWSLASARITPALGDDLVRLIDGCRVNPDAALLGLMEVVYSGRV